MLLLINIFNSQYHRHQEPCKHGSYCDRSGIVTWSLAYARLTKSVSILVLPMAGVAALHVRDATPTSNQLLWKGVYV